MRSVVSRHPFVSAVMLLIAIRASPAPLGAQRPPSPQQDPEGYAKFLEGAERVSRMQVPRVIAALGAKPGMKIADLGSGSGLFTRPLARAVSPGGVVYAIDINDALLKIVDRSAKEERIDNIRTVLGGTDDPRLPEPVDLVFICDTVHHIQNQPQYLKTLRKYLRPGGRVAVIDFSRNWPDGHESMAYSLNSLEGWMRDAGFQQVAAHDFLDNSFFVIWLISTSSPGARNGSGLNTASTPLKSAVLKPMPMANEATRGRVEVDWAEPAERIAEVVHSSSDSL
jgi:arsenite methyltransferase